MKINLKDGRFISVDIEINENGIYTYSSDGVLLGVYDPSKMLDSKFLETFLEKNNTLENENSSKINDELSSIIEQVKEEINKTDINVIEKEAEENRALGEYLREIGVDNKKIRRTDEISLESKEDMQDDKKETNEQVEKVSNKNNSAIEASKVNVKQEIELGERATDMQNLKRWLETSSGKTLPAGATKIVAIDSDELRKMKDENGKTIDNASSQWGLAIIRKDENGKMIAEPLKKYLPQLEQSRSAGTNPRKAQQQITEKTDGRTEKVNPINAEYTIDGSRRNIIDIDQDHLNDMEVHIGKYGPYTNETTRTQLRGKNTTFATDTEARKAAMGNFKGVHSGENSKKELDECNDSNKDYKDGDGNPTTKSQNHLSEMAREILNSSSAISDNYNQKDVEKHLKNMMENNKELNEKEIIESVTEEMEKTAELEHEPRGTESNQ